MKTANLSLGDWYPCAYWYLNMKHLYKSCSKLYLIVTVCLCMCECILRLCVVMNSYVCIEFVSNGTKNLTSKNNLLLKECHWIPKRQKYFTTSNYHMKISNDEFVPNYGSTLLSSRLVSHSLFTIYGVTST